MSKELFEKTVVFTACISSKNFNRLITRMQHTRMQHNASNTINDVLDKILTEYFLLEGKQKEKQWRKGGAKTN